MIACLGVLAYIPKEIAPRSPRLHILSARVAAPLIKVMLRGLLTQILCQVKVSLPEVVLVYPQFSSILAIQNCFDSLVEPHLAACCVFIYDLLDATPVAVCRIFPM